MSDFEAFCREYLMDPAVHLARSQDERDLVPQPPGDKVKVGDSQIAGKGVFPTDWMEEGEQVGLLLDMKFRRTAIIGRYINHSSNPTVRMRPIYSQGMVVIAVRPLLLADEITIDYRDVEMLRAMLKEQGVI